ncbi:HNH endonuclease [Nafulsella turpanensis]|uniref:HNH endonuclease n=1 Tax=Nafulsella turpanensis TaxID=1265690 RepID=UPI0003452CB1|nr:hypothetical protein [Nafulsella turpanensis]
MEEHTITFLALTDNIIYKVPVTDDGELDAPTQELIQYFSVPNEENQEITTIKILQQNTQVVRSKINEIVEKHKNGNPVLKSLPSFFRKLKSDEFFFFIPLREFNELEKLMLYDILKSKKTGENFEDYHKQTLKRFQNFLNNYTLSIFGSSRLKIGEFKRTKRRCRFCNNSRSNTTFENKAHAIPEGLGNKKLILFEECDDCNKEFSKSIEPHIIEYLSFFRTWFDVMGKGGVKPFSGKNFNMGSHEENKILEIFTNELEQIDPTKPFNLTFPGKYPVIPQNIYKALCKFFISVISSDQLEYFQETIKWIRGKKQIKKLPKVALAFNKNPIIQPEIRVSFRRDKNENLPHAVGEFCFTSISLVFIIPLSSQDKKDFTDEVDFDYFWSFFHHYEESVKWSFKNFSNETPNPLNFDFNFTGWAT